MTVPRVTRTIPSFVEKAELIEKDDNQILLGKNKSIYKIPAKHFAMT